MFQEQKDPFTPGTCLATPFLPRISHTDSETCVESAMVSTGSNDLFRNKLDLWWIRLAVILIIFPVVVVALKSPDILQVYLISDLVSASSIPVLIIGLSDACYWWRGFEVVIGGLGGLLTVFIFGTICRYLRVPCFLSNQLLSLAQSTPSNRQY